MELLEKKVKEIEMPADMKARIIKNCYQKSMNMEIKTMTKKSKNNFFKKPVVAVASLALCLFFTGVTVLAASGQLKGFFKDIKNWTGAVTGTSYEQATDEITVKVVEVTDELTVQATMVNPSAAPYGFIEEFGIHSFVVKDMSGKVVLKGSATTMVEIDNGQATIKIPLENLAAGTYTLVIDAFVGSSKADQPLVIHGDWEYEFTR